MDEQETTTHTYSVTETIHHIPEIYWLNKHFWFEDYDRVEENPELFTTEEYTITGVRFDADETPNDSPANPDGRSIWLTIRSDYEMDLPQDNPHHARSLGECSSSDSYLTKTETLLEHLGYDYETHEVLEVELADDRDGLYVTVCERVEHPTTSV